MTALTPPRAQRGHMTEMRFIVMLACAGIAMALGVFFAGGSFSHVLVAFAVPLGAFVALLIAAMILYGILRLYRKATVGIAVRLARNPNAAARLAAMPVGKLDPDAVDEDGNTALHLVCGQKPEGIQERICAVIAQLARHGANANIMNLSGVRPLTAAVGAGHGIEVVRALIAAGANPAVDENAMFAACYRRDGEAAASVAQLVRAGAPVTLVRPSWGETPLHVAAEQGAPETVKILLDAGASRHLRDKRARTALDIARERESDSAGQRHAIVALLEARGA